MYEVPVYTNPLSAVFDFLAGPAVACRGIAAGHAGRACPFLHWEVVQSTTGQACVCRQPRACLPWPWPSTGAVVFVAPSYLLTCVSVEGGRPSPTLPTNTLSGFALFPSRVSSCSPLLPFFFLFFWTPPFFFSFLISDPRPRPQQTRPPQPAHNQLGRVSSPCLITARSGSHARRTRTRTTHTHTHLITPTLLASSRVSRLPRLFLVFSATIRRIVCAVCPHGAASGLFGYLCLILAGSHFLDCAFFFLYSRQIALFSSSSFFFPVTSPSLRSPLLNNVSAAPLCLSLRSSWLVALSQRPTHHLFVLPLVILVLSQHLPGATSQNSALPALSLGRL